MRHFLVLFFCAALMVSASPATAADGSSIRGTVVDPSGRAVVGARVVLLSAAGDRVTVTDRAGRFVFDEVPAEASLHVAAERFRDTAVDLIEKRSASPRTAWPRTARTSSARPISS